MFYTTHQMFLTHRAVYILVNNLSQHIDDIVIDDEAYFDCEGSKHLRIESKSHLKILLLLFLVLVQF